MASALFSAVAAAAAPSCLDDVVGRPALHAVSTRVPLRPVDEAFAG